MEDNNRKLYPLRFVDEGADVPWGHVSYQIADLGFKDSMIDNGWFGGNTLSELMGTYLERVVGDDVFEFYGLQVPCDGEAYGCDRLAAPSDERR